MLKSFKEFKDTIVKNHEKLSTVKRIPIPEPKKRPPQVQKSSNVTVANIKLPSGITIKPARIQSFSGLEDIKTESYPCKFEEEDDILKTEADEVIALSDSSDDDFAASLNDDAGRVSEESEEEKPATRARRPQADVLAVSNTLTKMRANQQATVKPRDPNKRNYTGLKNKIVVTCDLCGFQTHKGFFGNHFRLAHLKISKRMYLTRTDASRSFYCDVCPKRFMTRDSLIHHQNYKHKDREEFTCNNCYSKFSSLELMKEHQRNFKCYKRLNRRPTEQSTEQVLCTLCGILTEKRMLSKHIARVHIRQKNFQCTVSEDLIENLV